MIIKNIKKRVMLSNNGSPYAKVSVQFEEYKDGKGNMRWLGGFGNKATWRWKVGDDVAPEITDDGKFLNFTFADDKENRLFVEDLPATVGFVLELVNGKKKPVVHKQVEQGAPAAEEVDEDIPF